MVRVGGSSRSAKISLDQALMKKMNFEDFLNHHQKDTQFVANQMNHW
jgi:hypothetical protein